MKTLLKTSLPALSLMVLVSCVDSGSTKKSSGNSGINQNEVVEVDGSNVQGLYSAQIWPINTNLHFKEIGSVGVARMDDSFVAAVNFMYGPKDTTVKQAIYTGRRCPNLNDDLNKDAFIDISEARIAIGQITVPFDNDLDSQLGGANQYPHVDGTGKMFYSRSASFSRMFSDLQTMDEDPSDQIVKQESGITFPGRVVLFQGAARTTVLPETVGTTDGVDKYDSLPVGCAVLWKVDAWPEELKKALPTSTTTETI